MNNKPATVIFCGTPDFAVPVLEALISNSDTIVTAVVTQPDRPIGRKKIMTAPPVKLLALQHGIPVLQPAKLSAADLESYDCDFLLVAAYGQILSKKVLQVPRIAPINVHGSLLPRWRGASPIQSAIAAGDTQTGITLQYMVYELDAGDILAVRTIPITPSTTSTELFTTMAHIGAELVVQTIAKPLVRTPQVHAQATYCHKLERGDGEVNPLHYTAEEIERLHRAYYPWPGVTLQLPTGPIKLHKASLLPSDTAATILCKNDSILYIEELQLPGASKITGAQWSAADRIKEA